MYLKTLLKDREKFVLEPYYLDNVDALYTFLYSNQSLINVPTRYVYLIKTLCSVNSK